jgi:hypothetical protein
MVRKAKIIEDNPKISDFINRTEESSDEELEIVVQTIKPPPAPKKRKVKLPSIAPSAPSAPSVANDYSSLLEQMEKMREELATSKSESASIRKQSEALVKENSYIRKNEIDARREMMRLKFN